MGHREILNHLNECLPEFAGDKIGVWFPNGRNSIRIRHHNKREYVFTYINPGEWCFETIDSFMKKMKKQ